MARREAIIEFATWNPEDKALFDKYPLLHDLQDACAREWDDHPENVMLVPLVPQQQVMQRSASDIKSEESFDPPLDERGHPAVDNNENVRQRERSWT